MVIEPNTANQFIEGYKAFLLYAGETEDQGSGEDFLYHLVQGRDAYLQERSLLGKFRNENKNIEDWIFEAIQDIEVTDWVYLRDTTKYSLFIRADQTAAYGVQGLTEPIKDIFGRSGIYLKTGIFPLGNSFVCDGLITNLASLGKHYKEMFNECYRKLKAEGLFFPNSDLITST